VTIKGRGFGGVMPAARMLAAALARQGKFVQAFPATEHERSQAPFEAMLRFDDERIDLRCLVTHPDHMIVMDPRLLAQPGSVDALEPNGWLIVNHPKRPHETKPPEHLSSVRLATVDANRIETHCKAWDVRTEALAGTMAGAFARVTGLVDLAQLVETIGESEGRCSDSCISCARLAFEEVCFER